VNRILIVRLGALGDIVHAIPVAAALRRAQPSLRIDWLVSARHREILDLVPVIDRRLAVNDRSGATGGRSILATLGELRRARYDVALDLQGLVKSAAFARLSGARRVIGFSSRFVREPLARRFYTEVHDPGVAGVHASGKTRHIVAINLGLLQTLGITAGSPEFPLDSRESEPVRTRVARVSQQVGARFALLNPGAAWPNKRWPPERLGQVARTLNERRGLKSVVLWGPGERPLGERVVVEADGAAVLAPETTIADIVALARRAAIMISGDTGPTHIAAAVGTPIVGIYGPTRPERNGPWSVDDVTVSRATTCQCHHLRQCKLERMCLMDIQVDEVVRAAERRLDARGREAIG
jgi:lipopolysaccharide heptosyltransferase I